MATKKDDFVPLNLNNTSIYLYALRTRCNRILRLDNQHVVPAQATRKAVAPKPTMTNLHADAVNALMPA